nr:MAG TPA: hypothetical protein [Caudoviricetes sp.]
MAIDQQYIWYYVYFHMEFIIIYYKVLVWIYYR